LLASWLDTALQDNVLTSDAQTIALSFVNIIIPSGASHNLFLLLKSKEYS
jgi:hypothetical protein